MLVVVAGLVLPDDVDPQVRIRTVRGRVLARRGEPRRGPARLAREGSLWPRGRTTWHCTATPCSRSRKCSGSRARRTRRSQHSTRRSSSSSASRTSRRRSGRASCSARKPRSSARPARPRRRRAPRPVRAGRSRPGGRLCRGARGRGCRGACSQGRPHVRLSVGGRRGRGGSGGVAAGAGVAPLAQVDAEAYAAAVDRLARKGEP